MLNYRLAVLAMLALLITSVISAMAAANSVPASGKLDVTLALTANNLKPQECAGQNLTNVIVGSGTLNGSSGNDLILGGAAADTIRGSDPAAGSGDGDDCILGGGGADTIYGDATLWGLWGSGDDILFGGNGDDAIYGDGAWGGSGADVCYGGAGTNIFNDCETTGP